MRSVTEMKERLGRTARAQAAQYSHGEQRPLGGYAMTMSVYAGTLAALAAAVLARREPVPDGLPVGDLVLCGVATHKLSRLIAKDPVTSPLRAPFTAFRGTQGPAELAEDARGQGSRKTVGELITCPFCTGMWIATGFTGGLLLLPRTTRLIMGALTAVTGADMLQFVHAWLERTAG